jgi:hypothetical protein
VVATHRQFRIQTWHTGANGTIFLAVLNSMQAKDLELYPGLPVHDFTDVVHFMLKYTGKYEI